MKHVQNHLGAIHNKATGIVTTRIKHGNAIAIIVTSATYENSPMYNQKARLCQQTKAII